MTIGNIRRYIRYTSAIHAWIPIAFLLIGPKRLDRILGFSVDVQRIQALQTRHDVLTHLLKTLSNAICQKGYEMVCVDSNVWLCFPRLFCWFIDHMEYLIIHSISEDCCPSCTIPREKLGEYSEAGYFTCSHQDYCAAYINSEAQSLKANSVNNINNLLWSIHGLNPLDLVRADILHNILLGVFKHMMGWVEEFLEHHD